MDVGHFPATAANSLIEGYCDDFVSLAAVLAQTLEQVAMRGIDISGSRQQLERIEGGMRGLAEAIHDLIERRDDQPAPTPEPGAFAPPGDDDDDWLTGPSPTSDILSGAAPTADLSDFDTSPPEPLDDGFDTSPPAPIDDDLFESSAPAMPTPAEPTNESAPVEEEQPEKFLGDRANSFFGDDSAPPITPTRAKPTEPTPLPPPRAERTQPKPTPELPRARAPRARPPATGKLPTAKAPIAKAPIAKAPTAKAASGKPRKAAPATATPAKTTPATATPDDGALRGTNESMPVLSVFQFLGRTRKSGTMKIELGNETLNFEFANGCVQSCTSNKPARGERLGDLLIESTNCTPADLSRLVKGQSVTATQLGAMAIKAGLATNGQVLEALEMQVHRRFTRACKAAKATYEFRDGRPSRTDGRIRIAPMELNYQPGSEPSL